MLTVIFSRASFRTLAKVFMPPVILSTLLCCVLPIFKRCPVPLGVSAVLVLVFDSVETLYYLWNLMLVDWWKSFTVGQGLRGEGPRAASRARVLLQISAAFLTNIHMHCICILFIKL